MKRKAPKRKSTGHWGKTKLEHARLKTRFELVPLHMLKPWADNPRINKPAVVRLTQQIKIHGFCGAIVATPDGMIRAGHTRYKACKLLELNSIWVHWKNFPTEHAAQMYSIADNKSGEWADWNYAKLSEIFKSRSVNVKDLEKLSGFTRQEIDWQGPKAFSDSEIDDFDAEHLYTLRIDQLKKSDMQRLKKRIEALLKKTKYKLQVI